MPVRVDLGSWPRRAHLELFRSFADPHFLLVSEVQAGRLLAACRARGLGAFAPLLYATVRAANEEEALRLRLRGDELWLHPVVHPSFTARVPAPEGPAAPGCDLPLFGYVQSPFCLGFADFAAGVAGAAAGAHADVRATACASRADVVYASSLPWRRFSGLKHAMGDPATDCVPRLMWGRAAAGGALDLSLQVHHGLADGGHVARWFDRVQAHLDDPAWLDT